ncbi:MAG: hypothetical protein FWE77_02755 [Clostridia bacterium]|nr:hypothetical protein [Clostridia bacterium]
MKRVSVKEIVLVTDSGMEIGAKFKPDGVEIRHPNAIELSSVADALIIFGEFLSGRVESPKEEPSAPYAEAASTYDPYESAAPYKSETPYNSAAPYNSEAQ